MKKMTAILLTLILTLSLSITAFADDTAETQKSQTKVQFDITPTYTVTIPQTVTLTPSGGQYTGTYSISAEKVRLYKEQQIEVKIQSDSGFKLSAKNTPAEVNWPYTVKTGNEAEAPAISNGDRVAVFNTDTQTQTCPLFFFANNPTYAGTYEDTVTFIISVTPMN